MGFVEQLSYIQKENTYNLSWIDLCLIQAMVFQGCEMMIVVDQEESEILMLVWKIADAQDFMCRVPLPS